MNNKNVHTLVLEAKLLTVLARLPDALFMPDRFVNSKYNCNNINSIHFCQVGYSVDQEQLVNAKRK